MKQLPWLALLGFGLFILNPAPAAIGQENPQVPKKVIGQQKTAGSKQDITVEDWWHGTLRHTDQIDRMHKHGKLQGSFFCHVCVVTLEKGNNYQIDMKANFKTSPDLDAYLRLEDDSGREIDADDDSGGGHDAQILFPCKVTGKYRIIATTSKVGTGDYFLQVTKMRAIGGQQDKQDKIGSVKEITVNQPWHGTLRDDDQRDRVRGTFCSVCVVTLEEGKNYQIDMKRIAKGDAYPAILDAYLRLEDPNGRHLDSNDDAPGAYGTTLDARIIFPCKAQGKYRIIATTFDGGTGDYTLQVTEMK